MHAINVLENYDIPTTSVLQAVQYLNDHTTTLSDSDYIDRISEMAGEPVNINDANPRLTYRYFVQETVTHPTFENKILFTAALNKAVEFVNKNKWVLVKGETPVDINGKPKAKKGAKKVLAQKLWSVHKNENLSRKEWIALLVEKVNLTPAGASTYHANLKAGRM